MKICTKCKIEKPETEYFKNKNQKSGLDPRCKNCAKIAKEISNNKIKNNDPEEWQKRRRKYVSTYKEKHPERVKQSYHNVKIKKAFGMSPEQYQELLLKQNGKCSLCESFPINKRLAVDHNHETNKVRGLLCSNCNTALGLFKDSIEVLKKAVEYLLNNA